MQQCPPQNFLFSRTSFQSPKEQQMQNGVSKQASKLASKWVNERADQSASQSASKQQDNVKNTQS